MYKSAAEPDAERPGNVRGVLDAWIREMPHFDVASSTSVGTGADGNWYQELSDVSTQARAELREITATYERALPPTLVDTLWLLIDNDIINIMPGAWATCWRSPNVGLELRMFASSVLRCWYMSATADGGANPLTTGFRALNSG